MSTFQNIANQQAYLTGALRTGSGNLLPGATVKVEAGATFVGSNYFDRYTFAGMIASGVDATTAAEEAMLLKTIDDGTPFSDSAGNTPNNVNVQSFIVGGNANTLINFVTLLGAPATFTSIETDSDVTVRLNDDTGADFYLKAGSVLTFNVGELLLNSVRIINSFPTGDADIQILSAATV